MRVKRLLMGGFLPGAVLLCSMLTSARANARPTSPPTAPPATPTQTPSTCVRNDPTLELPDLETLPPSHVRVVRHLGHRVVYFSTEIGNIGDGPMVLKGHTIQTNTGPMTQASQQINRTNGTTCQQVAGIFVFHPSHHHFHFADFSDYFLRKDDPLTGPIMGSSAKVSFCLLDLVKLPAFNLFPQIVPDCLNAEGTEGISAGWADVYDWFLPDQNIDLDADPAHPVPEGDYFLVNTVNPLGRLWEKDHGGSNNTSFVSVHVPAPDGIHPDPGAQAPPGVSLPGSPHQPHGVRAPRPPNGHMLITGSGPHHPNPQNVPNNPHSP